MKKIFAMMLIVAVCVSLGGCSAIQIIEKDEAALLAAKIAARRVGYAVAQNNPQYAADMIAYAKLLASAGDLNALVNEGLPLAIERLVDFADPMTRADIADLAGLLKIKAPDVDIAVKSALAQAAIAGFIEGCETAQ